jgi:hypothetical protein
MPDLPEVEGVAWVEEVLGVGVAAFEVGVAA